MKVRLKDLFTRLPIGVAVKINPADPLQEMGVEPCKYIFLSRG